MTDIEIKELTIGKFNEAYEHRMLEVEGVLQFLAIRKKEIKETQIFVASFSDGFFYEEFTFDPKIRLDFEKNTHQFDILRVQFCYYDYKTFQHLMLLNYQPILSGMSEAIGNPVQFSPNSTNQIKIKSNNMIPVTATKVSQCSTDTEGEDKASPYQIFLRKRNKLEYDDSNFNSISELTSSDKLWLIKARVVSKSELRDFQKNSGKFFSVVLKDRTGEIRAVFFKNVAEQYYQKIKEGLVYSFTGGEVEKASNYNCTSNPLEIIFKDNVLIQEQKNDSSIPMDEVKFLTIADILEKRENDIVDILAMVRDQHDMEIKDSKKGSLKELRKIRIVDYSDKEIDISVWGNSFHKVSVNKDEIYFFKNMKIRLFNNTKYLLWENYSKAETNITNYEALRRIKNYRTEIIAKRNKQMQKIAQAKLREHSSLDPLAIKNPLSNIPELLRRSNEFYKEESNRQKKLFFDITGFIEHIHENLWYESCGFRNCKKKITKNEDDVFFCTKCNIPVENPTLRFMTNLRIVDGVCGLEGRIFGEENCIYIFEKRIEELAELRASSEDSFLNTLQEQANNEFYIKIIVKYNTQPTDELYSIEIISVTPIEKELDKTLGYLYEMLSRKKLSN